MPAVKRLVLVSTSTTRVLIVGIGHLQDLLEGTQPSLRELVPGRQEILQLGLPLAEGIGEQACEHCEAEVYPLMDEQRSVELLECHPVCQFGTLEDSEFSDRSSESESESEGPELGRAGSKEAIASSSSLVDRPFSRAASAKTLRMIENDS